MNKALKWTLILVPVAVGGVVIYTQLKKYAVPSKIPVPTNSNGTLGQGAAAAVDQASGIPEATINTNNFPLKVGSNNKYVGELQDVLGVTIDNKFGPATQSALQEQAGVSQVASLAHLNSIEDLILQNDANTDAIAQKTSLSGSILSNYQNGASGGIAAASNITTLQDTNWIIVTQDPGSGNWIKGNSQIPLKAGTNLGTKYYVPYAVDAYSGNLIVYCNGGNILSALFGSNIGYWMADPNAISLT